MHTISSLEYTSVPCSEIFMRPIFLRRLFSSLALSVDCWFDGFVSRSWVFMVGFDVVAEASSLRVGLLAVKAGEGATVVELEMGDVCGLDIFVMETLETLEVFGVVRGMKGVRDCGNLAVEALETIEIFVMVGVFVMLRDTVGVDVVFVVVGLFLMAVGCLVG